MADHLSGPGCLSYLGGLEVLQAVLSEGSHSSVGISLLLVHLCGGGDGRGHGCVQVSPVAKGLDGVFFVWERWRKGLSGQGEAPLSQPHPKEPEALPSSLAVARGADTTEPRQEQPQRCPVPLTQADVVGEEVQEALALFLPVPAGVAGAPGSDAGRGVVDVVGGDGAACRDRRTSVTAGQALQQGSVTSLRAALLGYSASAKPLHDSSKTLQVLVSWVWFAPREEKRSSHNPFGHTTISTAFSQLKVLSVQGMGSFWEFHSLITFRE